MQLYRVRAETRRGWKPCMWIGMSTTVFQSSPVGRPCNMLLVVYVSWYIWFMLLSLVMYIISVCRKALRQMCVCVECRSQKCTSKGTYDDRA